MKRAPYILLLVVFMGSCQTRKSDYVELLDYQSYTKIDLPEANGKLIELNDSSNYRFFYLEYVNDDSVTFWYNGKQTNLDSFSVEYSENLINEYSVLFIDKHIKMRKVDKLFDILSGYLLNKSIIVISNSGNKNELFGLNMFLPPKEELLFEPYPTLNEINIIAPLPEYPTNFNTYISRNDSIFLNNEFIEKETLTRWYRLDLINNQKNSWYFYVDSNSNFQSYVNMTDLFYTVAYEERQKLSMQKYNMELEDLLDSEYKEIRKQLPIRLARLSNVEFDNLLIINKIVEE